MCTTDCTVEFSNPVIIAMALEFTVAACSEVIPSDKAPLVGRRQYSRQHIPARRIIYKSLHEQVYFEGMAFAFKKKTV